MPSTSSPLVLPPPSAVRPASCPHCGIIAGQPGAYNLWSHGSRFRDVVVPGPGDRVVLVSSWVRRFLCQGCDRTCSVQPREVLFRHVYSLPAIVLAWFHAVAPPVGDGLDDPKTYALIGLDRPLLTQEPGHAGARRWRSLRRWVDSASSWWPTRSLTGATWRAQAASLLVGFVVGDDGREGATRRAVSAHVAGGTAM